MKLCLEDFRTAPATHIVSLGRRCAVAYNLRRFYNFQSAFPFDWWISPLGGVVQFLERPDVDCLYDPEELELSHNGSTVRHRTFQIQLHHEFPKDASHTGRLVRDDWRDAIEHPKRRTTALLKKFLGLNAPGNRVAFVREDDATADQITERLNELFPLADYLLVELPKFPGGMNDEHGWKGNPTLWNEALRNLNLTLDRTRHSPFEETKGLVRDDNISAH
ncbi:MAG TPA: DUF1796 family putative cysteine peptidase [Rhizomicrobium sp.]